MYCGNCGKELDKALKFCKYCGNKIEKEEDALERKTYKKRNIGKMLLIIVLLFSLAGICIGKWVWRNIETSYEKSSIN